MKTKKKNSPLSDSDLADAYIIPQVLSKKQQAGANTQLAEARKKSRARLTETDRLSLKLMQLRFQMEDYLKREEFDSSRTFGYFLKEYLHLLNVKSNEFAGDISIHATLLSQLMNDKRPPNDNIMIRLELHSNNTFPAIYWHRLVEKEKEYIMRTNQQIRQKESKHVKRKLILSQADSSLRQTWLSKPR